MRRHSQTTFSLRPPRSALVRYLYATLIASLAITPQRVHHEARTDTDVTRIQALVARALRDGPASRQTPATIILDLQRTLGDKPDPKQHDRRDDRTQLFATTSASERSEAPPFPARSREPIPESAFGEVLQGRGSPLPPPPAHRSTERYRMNLMPHAPPAPHPYAA